jgi:hypothetical protein
VFNKPPTRKTALPTPHRMGRYRPAQMRVSLSNQCSTYEQPASRTFASSASADHHHPERMRWPAKLLRKEVIQPHLPVRLPCYDFVLIAGPTFDRSPHKG